MAGLQSNIITELFSRELEEILLSIFLSLDPSSLKNCRLTCSLWNEFILRRIWGSKAARKHLGRKLQQSWRLEEPIRILHRTLEGGVHFMVCSEELVIISMDNHTDGVFAYHAHGGDFKYKVLNCKRNGFDIGIQLDIGPTYVLAVSGTGLVTIFDKKDGRVECREDLEATSYVFGIKMLKDRALTGDDNGVIRILERNSEKEWKFVKTLSGNRGITHIDGTRNKIQCLDLQNMALVETKKEMPIKVWMLSYYFPYAFVVGGEDWTGFKMFNVMTGETIRDIKVPQAYHNVQCTGQILTLSEINLGGGGMLGIVLYDVNQLTDTNLKDKDLWFKRTEFQVSRALFSQVEAVANKTKLFVSSRGKLSVFDFWKDGAIPICEEADSDNEILLDLDGDE